MAGVRTGCFALGRIARRRAAFGQRRAAPLVLDLRLSGRERPHPRAAGRRVVATDAALRHGGAINGENSAAAAPAHYESDARSGRSLYTRSHRGNTAPSA